MMFSSKPVFSGCDLYFSFYFFILEKGWREPVLCAAGGVVFPGAGCGVRDEGN